MLDQNLGATNGGESWFDITSYLEGVRNGAEGAEAILTGVSPAVAQILVDLDADLTGLVTFGSLRAGIAHAARRRRPR